MHVCIDEYTNKIFLNIKPKGVPLDEEGKEGGGGLGHAARKGFRLKAWEDKGNKLNTAVISKTRLG